MNEMRVRTSLFPLAVAATAAVAGACSTFDRLGGEGEPAAPREADTASAARPCRSADLRARGDTNGAGGTIVVSIGFVNRSGRPCLLRGRAAVELFDPVGRRLRADVYEAKPLGPTRPGVLEPGRKGGLILFWRNWCGRRPPGYDRRFTARVDLPARGGTLTVPFRGTFPRCDVPSEPPALGVSPLARAAR